MKLSILIPHYNEFEQTVKVLLDSIVCQQNINFKEIEIILVNDGGKPLTDNFLSFYFKQLPNFKYIRHKHIGIAANRQYLLDLASSNYIMYCDADDALCNSYCLSILIPITELKPDLITSPGIIVESYDERTGQIKSVIDYDSQHFNHGKIYNKNFLKSNNLCWNKKLKIHEDVEFNFLVMQAADYVEVSPIIYYVWKRNINSVTANRVDLFTATFKDSVKANMSIINALMSKNQTDLAIRFIFDLFYILFAYYTKLVQEKQLKQKHIKVIKKFFNSYGKYIVNDHNGILSYLGLSDAWRQILVDPEIKGILLDVNDMYTFLTTFYSEK